MDEMDRETLTKFHKPDRRLAEIQDRERAASSDKERRDIRRAYYRQVRAEAEAAGDGRRYEDRRDMMNSGRRDTPIGALGPSVDAHAETAATPAPRARRGRLFSIGWTPKR